MHVHRLQCRCPRDQQVARTKCAARRQQRSFLRRYRCRYVEPPAPGSLPPAPNVRTRPIDRIGIQHAVAAIRHCVAGFDPNRWRRQRQRRIGGMLTPLSRARMAQPSLAAMSCGGCALSGGISAATQPRASASGSATGTTGSRRCSTAASAASSGVSEAGKRWVGIMRSFLPEPERGGKKRTLKLSSTALLLGIGEEQLLASSSCSRRSRSGPRRDQPVDEGLAEVLLHRSGIFAGFTSMTPYWLNSRLSPSTTILRSPRFLKEIQVPRSDST